MGGLADHLQPAARLPSWEAVVSPAMQDVPPLQEGVVEERRLLREVSPPDVAVGKGKGQNKGGLTNGFTSTPLKKSILLRSTYASLVRQSCR